MIFKCAKEYQPSIILLEDVEHFFPKKTKSKKMPLLNLCQKFKKDLVNLTNKFLLPEDKVIIIGLATQPYYANQVDMKKYFNKSLYFPFPNYLTRQKLFEHFVKQSKFHLSSDFDVENFLNSTEGYPAGSIKNSIAEVLSESKKKLKDTITISIYEFINSISTQYVCSQEEYE